MSKRVFTDETAKQILKAMLETKYASDTTLTDIEKEVAVDFESRRNGKIYATKIWHFATNQTSAGERMLDSVGMKCEPSTDTEVGQDDFMTDSVIFQWKHCNYTRDSDGTARVTAIEGRSNYKTEGAVDIGTLCATFWWKREDHGTYDIWYMSDSPNDALGLVPWCEAVTSEGKVLPYYIESSYMSVMASDGLLRSQKGVPAYNQSYNSQVTDYQKKGKGYWGGSGAVLGRLMLMLIIKYATKNSQTVFQGCSNFATQVKVAYAESDTTRILLSSSSPFYVGCCVCVGDGTTTDRQAQTTYSLANRVAVKSIESVTIDSTTYYALNLDTSTAFTTTTSSLVSTMPCFSGETDKVVGHYDGSYLSNTDGKHSFRICGVEIQNGQVYIPADTVMRKYDDSWQQWVAPRGTAHVSNAYTGYAHVGDMPYNSGNDTWSGDLTIDPGSGVIVVTATGTSSGNGCGDRIWEGGTGLPDNTLKEHYSLGNLWDGAGAGLVSVNCGADLFRSSWLCGSRD